MKWVKCILGIFTFFIGVAISISGIVATINSIIPLNITEFIAGILTIAIGLYLGRIGLKLFRQWEFKFW